MKYSPAGHNFEKHQCGLFTGKLAEKICKMVSSLLEQFDIFQKEITKFHFKKHISYVIRKCSRRSTRASKNKQTQTNKQTQNKNKNQTYN